LVVDAQMIARENRGFLTINNVVEVSDEAPEMVLELVQAIIDEPEYDVPEEAVSPEHIHRLQMLQSYYGNQYPYLVGLWGALRFAAGRTDAHKIAMRDYLEKAASACKLKFETASRLLTGFQEINREQGERKFYA
jgi:hypothetical protein